MSAQHHGSEPCEPQAAPGAGWDGRDAHLGETAHDLANLLQILGGSLNMMKRELDQPDMIRSRLATAMVGVTLCMSLSRSLFAAGPVRDDGALLLQSVIEGGRPLFELAAGPDIDIEILSPLAPLWVRVDRVGLERALLNLVINAAQAVAGPGLIRVEYRVEGDQIVLSVEDDGPGFTAQAAACALDRHFTTRARGSGLGLASVHALVKSAGGLVVLSRSDLGGACAKLIFPRRSSAGARGRN